MNFTEFSRFLLIYRPVVDPKNYEPEQLQFARI